MSIPQTDQDFMSHRTTPTTSSNSGAENNLMSSSRISSNTTNSQTSRIMPNWSDIFPPPPLEQPPPIPPPNSNSSSRNNIFNNLRIQQVKMKAGHLETWNLPLLIAIVVFRQETWVLQHPAGNSNSQTWSTMEFSRGWRVKVGKVSISMKTLRSIIPPGHLSPTVHFWAPEGWTPPRINLLVTDQKLDFRPTNLWKKSLYVPEFVGGEGVYGEQIPGDITDDNATDEDDLNDSSQKPIMTNSSANLGLKPIINNDWRTNYSGSSSLSSFSYSPRSNNSSASSSSNKKSNKSSKLRIDGSLKSNASQQNEIGS